MLIGFDTEIFKGFSRDFYGFGSTLKHKLLLKSWSYFDERNEV